MMRTPKPVARLAGILYLILIPVGFFGVTYIPSLLVAPGDIAATVRNFVASESLFRLSLVSSFLMNIVIIVLVLVLYRLFKPAGKNAATLMVVFLLVGATISMLSELNHFAALVLSGGDAAAAFTAEQSHYLVQVFLDMREYGSFIAAIFWGLWLFPLGYLIVRSRFVPRILGALLILAGVVYLIDSFALFLVPHYGITISDFTFIGEVLFPLWLLIKGVDLEWWGKRAEQTRNPEALRPLNAR